MRALGLRLSLTACLGLLGLLGVPGCGSSGPPASLAVVQSTDMGVIGNNPKILGRDGGYSGTFAGNSVWVFGDTFLANPNAEGQTLISDSWESTTDLNAAQGITGFQEREDSAGAPAMLLSYSAAEISFNTAHQGNPCQEQPCGARWALWPGAVVEDTARVCALVYYLLVMAQPGNFNFAGGLAIPWRLGRTSPIFRSAPATIRGADHPDLLFGQNAPSFGAAGVALPVDPTTDGCNGSILGSPCGSSVRRPEKRPRIGSWSFYAGSRPLAPVPWAMRSPEGRRRADHERVVERLSAVLRCGLRRTIFHGSHDAHGRAA